VNSRERLWCALNHQTPDRLPVDLGGTRQSGIHASAYQQLKRHLGFNSPTRVFELYQMLAEVERPVMDRFGADVVGLYRPEVAFGIRNERWKPWRLFDGTPVEVPGDFAPQVEPDGSLVLMRGDEPIARMPQGGFYFDRLEKYPGAAHVDPATFQPTLLTSEQCAHYRAQSRALYEQTDFAIVAPLGPPYELFYGLGTGGFEAWMITLANEPDYVHALYEKLIDAWIENLRRFADAVEDRVQVIQFCDDFGMQDSLLLSVPMFRRLILPHYQRGLAWIKQNTSMKIMLHSDGAIFPLIPTLIEMGVEILNPVQTSAAGMDPGKLKEQFGDRLVFWGGSLDCQQTLPNGTPEDVADEVRRHVEILAPGGGYVFAPVHNIQAGVPPENIVAMFEAVQSRPSLGESTPFRETKGDFGGA
jgi:uroporphyrinogen decarboxylase